MIVGAFLQPPSLPLLRGGVVAVVVQEEGPHLTADGRVDTTKEDRLGKGGKKKPQIMKNIMRIRCAPRSADGAALSKPQQMRF